MLQIVKYSIPDIRNIHVEFHKIHAVHIGCVPFDQNFRFDFSKFTYVEWNGIFHFAGPISFHSRLSTSVTRQNAEGSWKSGCFKRRKLLPKNKFNTYKILPQYLPDRLKHHFRVMRATCELFSWESIAILTVYKQVFWYLNFANHRTKNPLFQQPINLWLAH